MYQEYGTTSITSTHPRFEWTQKTAGRLWGFESTSTCPLENAIRRIVEKKKPRFQTCLPIQDVAFSSGHVDAPRISPSQSCDNLRPLEYGPSGRDGHLSDEVTR
jgi:hypothetical protein